MKTPLSGPLGSPFQIRLAEESDIPEIRRLVNSAYQELADRGLNYTATYQDEKETRERMQKGRTFLLTENQCLIATILFFTKNYFTNRRTAYVGQFAVTPLYKKRGLGSYLMDHCENLARAENFEGLQLDTAQPATHLVQWYLRRGYKIVGEMHWDGKTYDSFIFEKKLN